MNYSNHLVTALGMAAMAKSFLSSDVVRDTSKPRKKKKPKSIRDKKKKIKKSKRKNRKK